MKFISGAYVGIYATNWVCGEKIGFARLPSGKNSLPIKFKIADGSHVDKELSYRRETALKCGSFLVGMVAGDGLGQTILCTKRCRCQKTKSIDLLHDKSTFIRKTGYFAFLSPSSGLRSNIHCSTF